MRTIPMAALLLLAASAAGAAGFERVEFAEARLRCLLPAAWERTRDAAKDERQKVYGVLAAAKRGKAGTPASIIVEYYAPDNMLFKDTGSYIAANTFEPVEEERPKLAEQKLKGRKAWTFSRERAIARRPGSLAPDPVAVREEHWVIAADGGGFHALVFAAPDAEFKSQRKTFDRVLKSLEFLPASPKKEGD